MEARRKWLKAVKDAKNKHWEKAWKKVCSDSNVKKFGVQPKA